jgi:hypothetical protein
MRPTRPEILEVLARHPRWSSRYRIRKALACNPATPDTIARRLLPTLMRQDLRHALEAGVLPAELVPEVRRMLRGRDADTSRASSELDESAPRKPGATGQPSPSDHPSGEESSQVGSSPPELSDDELGV